MAKLVFLQDLGYPFLGPMSLAAMLNRHGHQADLLIGDKADDFLPTLKHEDVQNRAANILGLSGETMDAAFETVRLNMQIRTDFPWASLFMPNPTKGRSKQAEARLHGTLTMVDNVPAEVDSITRNKISDPAVPHQEQSG